MLDRSKKLSTQDFRTQSSKRDAVREAKITLEPGEKKKAKERRKEGNAVGGSKSAQEVAGTSEAAKVVADESGIGSKETYRRLHKVMLAAGEGYEETKSTRDVSVFYTQSDKSYDHRKFNLQG